MAAEHRLDHEPSQRDRPLEDRLHGVRPVPQGHVGGVLSGGEEGHQDLEADLGVDAESPLGCEGAGCVGVEGQDHPVAEPLDRSEMIFSERRTARRNRGADADLVQRHHIRVPLRHDSLAGAHHFPLRPVEAVQELALVIQRGLG